MQPRRFLLLILTKAIALKFFCSAPKYSNDRKTWYILNHLNQRLSTGTYWQSSKIKLPTMKQSLCSNYLWLHRVIKTMVFSWESQYSFSRRNRAFWVIFERKLHNVCIFSTVSRPLYPLFSVIWVVFFNNVHNINLQHIWVIFARIVRLHFHDENAYISTSTQRILIIYFFKYFL
jgi:hypothetical protein